MRFCGKALAGLLDPLRLIRRAPFGTNPRPKPGQDKLCGSPGRGPGTPQSKLQCSTIFGVLSLAVEGGFTQCLQTRWAKVLRGRRFYKFVVCFGGQHHSTRSSFTGNPAHWACWESESLNKLLATVGSSAHSSHMERDALSKCDAIGSGGAKKMRLG